MSFCLIKKKCKLCEAALSKTFDEVRLPDGAIIQVCHECGDILENMFTAQHRKNGN